MYNLSRVNRTPQKLLLVSDYQILIDWIGSDLSENDQKILLNVEGLEKGFKVQSNCGLNRSDSGCPFRTQTGVTNTTVDLRTDTKNVRLVKARQGPDDIHLIISSLEDFFSFREGWEPNISMTPDTASAVPIESLPLEVEDLLVQLSSLYQPEIPNEQHPADRLIGPHITPSATLQVRWHNEFIKSREIWITSTYNLMKLPWVTLGR